MKRGFDTQNSRALVNEFWREPLFFAFITELIKPMSSNFEVQLIDRFRFKKKYIIVVFIFNRSGTSLKDGKESFRKIYELFSVNNYATCNKKARFFH